MKQAAPMLAAAGVPISVELLKVAKHAGAPGFDASGRVDCDQVAVWLRDPRNDQLLNSPTARKAIAEARHEEAKLERTEFRNGIEQGRYLEKRLIADRLLKLSADQVTVLRQKVENEFPPMLVGKGLEEIRTECRALVDRLHALMELLVKDWKEEKA